tara:strand:- start:391 stop:555 length:165 start_codon:yes stop_codon:yes gene_type:complete
MKEKIMGKQNDKLIKNMKEYDKKEKAKQQKSKVLGQKSIKRKINKKESTRMYHS